MNVLDIMKQALEALEDYPADTRDTPQDEAITNLRAAIEQIEKAEPVAWIDGADLRGVLNGNSGWVHTEDQGRMIPLYTHPAPAVPDDPNKVKVTFHDGVKKFVKVGDDLWREEK